MKCPVCNSEYEGSLCPVCGFEDVQIVGDYDEGMKQLKPAILAHRKKFLGEYQIGIILKKRKDTNSTDVSVIDDTLFFGKVKDLLDGDKWLERSIVAYPDSDNAVKVEACLSNNGAEHVETVSIGGLKTAGIIDIGIHVNDYNSFCLKIKVKDEVAGTSETIQIRKDLPDVG